MNGIPTYQLTWQVVSVYPGLHYLSPSVYWDCMGTIMCSILICQWSLLLHKEMQALKSRPFRVNYLTVKYH